MWISKASVLSLFSLVLVTPLDLNSVAAFKILALLLLLLLLLVASVCVGW